MKTPQEIRELLEQVKLQGRFRRTPTDFVLVEVLLNLNERLTVLETEVDSHPPSENTEKISDLYE